MIASAHEMQYQPKYFDPYDDRDHQRLSKAVELSYKGLAPFRKMLRGLVAEYCGSGYGDAGSRPRFETIVNYMNQAVDTYTMLLAANRPRVMLSTDKPELQFFAKQFEAVTNATLAEIQIEETIRQWVIDAFFCLGIVKVHMADAGEVMMENGFWMDPGRTFASNVSLDNFVFDSSATVWHHIRYAGDCYRVPFERLKDPVLYDQDEVKELGPNSKFKHMDEDRLARMSRGDVTDADELVPMIDLGDFWIVETDQIVTYPVDRDGDQLKLIGERPIAVDVWDGPEFGPYHTLSFNDVPENIMPTSPASQLDVLGRTANSLLRKARRQAMRQKQVTGYSPASAEDAKNFRQASDGEMIEMSNPKEVMTLTNGQVDGQNMALFNQFTQLHDRQAGNLSAMAGLGPSADTAKAESLIHGAASKKEAQMQYRVLDSVTKLCRDLGYMEWINKTRSRQLQIPVAGTDYTIDDQPWTPEMREGDFFDYNFQVDAFSMAYQPPGQKIQALDAVVTKMTQLHQLLAQQGGTIDMQALVEEYADLLQLPRLRNIVKFMVPDPAMQQQQAQQGGQNPQTTREYVRRNVPTGGTEQGRQHVQQQAWMNGQGQNNPQQQAMVGAA